MGYQYSVILNVPVLTVSNIVNVARVLVIQCITTKVEVFMEKRSPWTRDEAQQKSARFHAPFFL